MKSNDLFPNIQPLDISQVLHVQAVSNDCMQVLAYLLAE